MRALHTLCKSASVTKNANKKFNALTHVQKRLTINQKSLYFPLILNQNLATVR